MAERLQFVDQLSAKWDEGKFVCVGLDPVEERLPEHLKGLPLRDAYFQFLTGIIDKTHDIVCAYKPQIACYESNTEAELALEDTVLYLHSRHPEIPVLVDAKRGDIGHTNTAYAHALFGRYGFDGSTFSPYLGDSTYPDFLNPYPGKGLVAICKTSNPGSRRLQNLQINLEVNSEPIEENGEILPPLISKEEAKQLKELTGKDNILFYQLVAYRHGPLAQDNRNIGIVVGATYAEQFVPVRKVNPNGLILVPGIGAQGGDLDTTVRLAFAGLEGNVILNNAREIIYASSGRDFADAGRGVTLAMHNRVTGLRAA